MTADVIAKLDAALSILNEARLDLYNSHITGRTDMHDELYEAQRRVRRVKSKLEAAAPKAQRQEAKR